MPSVDFNLLEVGQSEIRNKILAPVFKRLGIIEQWGNGLKLISEDLANYPEIDLSWKEPGVAFRVTFTNTAYTSKPDSNEDLQTLLEEVETKLGLSQHQVGTKLAPSQKTFRSLYYFSSNCRAYGGS